MTAANRLLGPGAWLGGPTLHSKHRTSAVAEFNPAGHLNGIVAEEQGDSFIDAVLEYPASGIDESDLGDIFAIDPTAQTQKSRPAPATEIGPGGSPSRLVAASAPSAASSLPRPIRLLDRAEYVLPGACLGVFELDRHHRTVALDSFLEETDGVRPSLEGMSAAVHRRTGRGPGGGDAWRPCDVGLDRLSRGIHLRDSDDSEKVSLRCGPTGSGDIENDDLKTADAARVTHAALDAPLRPHVAAPAHAWRQLPAGPAPLPGRRSALSRWPARARKAPGLPPAQSQPVARLGYTARPNTGLSLRTDDELVQYLSLSHELQGVEFKPPGSRKSGDLFARVTRGVLAMSNRREGGVVIVGVEEGLRRRPKPLGVDNGDLATWTYDDVAAGLAPFADPSVRFRLSTPSDGQRTFVALEVDAFDEVPVICRKKYPANAKRGDPLVLRIGAIYVRSRGKPESVEIPSQTEMRELLELATERRMAALLGSISRAGLGVRGRPAASEAYAAELDDDFR